jgi:hypothetical protein
MLTMEEYKIIDTVLVNYLQENDLIKINKEIFEVINIKDTPQGFDIVVIDNYDETKIISVPDGSYINIAMEE